jgi:hypothetical protein
MAPPEGPEEGPDGEGPDGDPQPAVTTAKTQMAALQARDGNHLVTSFVGPAPLRQTGSLMAILLCHMKRPGPGPRVRRRVHAGFFSAHKIVGPACEHHIERLTFRS